MERRKVDITIIAEDFQHYRKGAKEHTSSSYSKLHFGHWKTRAGSDYILDIHTLKLSLITASGVTPERWVQGLNDMLEKATGVALATKLRAILLMETDFNYHNTLIFGQ